MRNEVLTKDFQSFESLDVQRATTVAKCLNIKDLNSITNLYFRKGIYYLVNESDIPETLMLKFQHKIRLFLKTVIEHELDPLLQEIYLLNIKNQNKKLKLY